MTPPKANRPCCAAALASALLLAGCAPGALKVPEADPTSPYSALDVVGAGERLVLFSGEGSREVDLPLGDSLVLIGLGEDRDGGVKELVLSGQVVARCADNLGGKHAVRTARFSRRHILPASPGGRSSGSRSARYVLKADSFLKICGAGEVLALTGAAGVRVANYHGLSAKSPTLEFRLAPTPWAGEGDSLRTASAADLSETQSPQTPQETEPIFGPLPADRYPDTPRI